MNVMIRPVRVGRNLIRWASSTPNFIATTPSPTRPCCVSPTELDIDTETPLWGRAPLFTDHLIVSTGRLDWTSKIEDDPHGWFARDLKNAIVKRRTTNGADMTSFLPAVTCSSLAPETPLHGAAHGVVGVYSFPDSQYHEIHVSESKHDPCASFVDELIVHKRRDPGMLRPSAGGTDAAPLQGPRPATRHASGITVLICGHKGRDHRCGVLGPLLQLEFTKQLQVAGITVDNSPPNAVAPSAAKSKLQTARIALVSHVGGHKWAGNVIIYFSPSIVDHALAGMGIWYGRVMPENVEGIISETILGGRVIEDICRAGLHLDGSPLKRT